MKKLKFATLFIVVIAIIGATTSAYANNVKRVTHTPKTTYCNINTTGHSHAGKKYVEAWTSYKIVDDKTNKVITDVYHYSRARGEQRLFGKTLWSSCDSGRKYKNGSSYAKSTDCFSQDLVACTYYGT